MNNKIQFTTHRINSVEDLNNIPNHYGVEVDIRDYKDQLLLVHDPFITNSDELTTLEELLKNFQHRFIILNIKSEGIEYRVQDLLKKYQIIDYFFLDCSFPMIHKLTRSGESKIALRYSEYESIETVLSMAGKVDWVWVDCFTRFPLTEKNFGILKQKNFKICLVSPELQGRPEEIENYRTVLNERNIVPDMICTKIYNVQKWTLSLKGTSNAASLPYQVS